MKALFNRFVGDDTAQDLIEYGLLIGIITVSAVTAISLIGSKVASYFGNLDTNLP
jgi:Flp pilus assembly pilin Flp